MWQYHNTLITLILFVLSNNSCTEFDNTREIISNKSEITKHIRFLSSDELRGRHTGSPEAKIAARYILENFRFYKIKTFCAYPDYLQSYNGSLKHESDSFQCSNVIGYIEGTDSILNKEYIVLVAHYDHLGVKNNIPNSNSDSIYNGARDNGIGVSALLHSANILSQKHPKRSIIFLATSGEEYGMLGSHFFVENCPVNEKDILFVLNNDGGGFNDASLIRVGGMELVDYPQSLLSQVKENYQTETLSYPEELQYLYERGDNISFARKGIPSITISPGFDKIDENIIKYIHNPGDEVNDDFDLDYLYKFCQIFSNIAYSIANSEQVPGWKKDTEYYHKNLEK